MSLPFKAQILINTFSSKGNNERFTSKGIIPFAKEGA
jgi:hypothetical protein